MKIEIFDQFPNPILKNKKKNICQKKSTQKKYFDKTILFLNSRDQSNAIYIEYVFIPIFVSI